MIFLYIKKYVVHILHFIVSIKKYKINKFIGAQYYGDDDAAKRVKLSDHLISACSAGMFKVLALPLH